jgi:geranylgeranyl pyrophosphate synthase
VSQLAVPPDLVKSFLEESRKRVDRCLDEALPAEGQEPALLHEAMRYAVFSGGKRLRPALAFGASLACGNDPDRVLPVAAAVELVHAYSLVHDDLPAMDDDTERRGRPTVHVRFDEATAILVGDALLAHGFAVLARGGVPMSTVAALAQASGSTALVGGQVADLAFRPEAASESTIAEIHRRKTAALFGFAVVGAARTVGAPAEVESALARFSEHYGLAFQLTDDLLDERPGECSVLAVLSKSEATLRVQEHVRAALEALEPLPQGADPLRGLAEQLPRRVR